MRTFSKNRLIAPLFFTILWLLPAPPASAQEWLIDIDHSAAHFTIRHMTIAMVRGHFAELTGTAVFDEQSGKMTNMQIIIGVKSVDTGVAKRDEHLRSADFFEVDKYPVMTFLAKKIEPGKIIGDLTIKGITKQVIADLHGPTETIKDPWGNLRKGGKITAVIDRTDFGITYNNTLANGGMTIGNTVEIVTDFEIVIPDSTPTNP